MLSAFQSHTVSFQANNTLTATNVIFAANATGELKARDEVHINPNFEARNSSEVHIYCAPSFADCSEFPTGWETRSMLFTDNTNNPQNENEIEIQFIIKPTDWNFTLQPNPNTGLFTLNISTDNSTENYQIKVINLMGMQVYTSSIANLTTLSLDFSHLSKGIYYMQVSNKTKTITKKLILQ